MTVFRQLTLFGFLACLVSVQSFDCPYDGWFADPENCLKYYHCVGLTKQRLTCPVADNGQQEHYDPEKNWCNYPSMVDCGDRPICDRDDQNCQQQTTTTEDPNAFHCPADGYFADPFNCRMYYHCFNGVAEEHLTCQANQLWSNEHGYCDWSNTVDCGDRPICDANGENCHFQATTTMAPDAFKCPGDGYFGDPKNCIKYYHCYNGAVEEHVTCQKDNYGRYMCFDDVNKWCNYRDTVNCGNRPYCDANDQNCQ